MENPLTCKLSVEKFAITETKEYFQILWPGRKNKNINYILCE